RLCIPYIIPC
uniref:Signiferin-1 n=2 Tax=Crinia TaxID=8373 RepID=SIG1_CRIDS|nr:RecName: Full=Signiferin-1 [Crinia deserticola]P86130.1 RecName: Full=Signiferin-1 [Crinia signifera]